MSGRACGVAACVLLAGCCGGGRATGRRTRPSGHVRAFAQCRRLRAWSRKNRKYKMVRSRSGNACRHVFTLAVDGRLRGHIATAQGVAERVVVIRTWQFHTQKHCGKGIQSLEPVRADRHSRGTQARPRRASRRRSAPPGPREARASSAAPRTPSPSPHWSRTHMAGTAFALGLALALALAYGPPTLAATNSGVKGAGPGGRAAVQLHPSSARQSGS